MRQLLRMSCDKAAPQAAASLLVHSYPSVGILSKSEELGTISDTENKEMRR